MGVGSLKVKCQSQFILFLFLFYWFHLQCFKRTDVCPLSTPPVKLTHNLCTLTGL
uniref:Uncharacterized protein n=1 Tax=Anguilla anguilla TaxID=7936 RepID=A0A0E9PSS5_ANGAN